MKRRLAKTATAAAMAVAVTLPTTAKPANAVEITTVITVIKGAYDTLSQFFGGGLSTQDAVEQLKTAIAQAQTAIVDEIDTVAAANVRSCAESAVINYNDIDAFSPDTLQSYALAMTDCVTQADSLLSSLTDLAAVDQVGFALQSVAPLALIARAKAGLSTTALRSTIIDASNTTVTRLFPTCYLDPWHGPSAYFCIAYDGTLAIQALPADYVAVQDQATANTSRAVAQKALTSI